MAEPSKESLLVKPKIITQGSSNESTVALVELGRTPREAGRAWQQEVPSDTSRPLARQCEISSTTRSGRFKANR
jgi:hypothetical protein